MIRRSIVGVLGLVMLGAMLVSVRPAAAEIIDRIVVVIDNNFIITSSDVRRERAIQTAFGGKPGNDDQLIESLIEKYFVEEQIALFREIAVAEDEVDERLRAVTTPPGVTSEELRDFVRAELRRREFTIQRFGPFIQVSDDELRRYFEQVVVPALRQRGQAVPPIEQGMLEVRPIVLAEKISKELGEWLAELSRRRTIEKILK
jgi:hypothetical protein